MLAHFALRTSDRQLCQFACAVAVLASAATLTRAQIYNDGLGKEWRSVPSTTGLTWDQVASVCPTDGITPCSGIVSGRDMNGWRWATRDQVLALFATFTTDINIAGCVGGPQYAAVGIYALGGGVIAPTWSAYTTFGGSLYVSGWTATLEGTQSPQRAYVGDASANYPVFDGSFCVAGLASKSAIRNFNGVWMWRPVGCALPVVSQETQTIESCAGQRVTISVAASEPSLTFQWRRNGVPLNTQQVPSASTNTLVFDAAAANASGIYDCLVRNTCGGVSSGAVTLNIAASCCDSLDFNNDDLYPTDEDLVEFLFVLAGSPCSTDTCNDIDFNNDGLFPDDNDLTAFLRVLAGGPC